MRLSALQYNNERSIIRLVVCQSTSTAGVQCGWVYSEPKSLACLELVKFFWFSSPCLTKRITEHHKPENMSCMQRVYPGFQLIITTEIMFKTMVMNISQIILKAPISFVSITSRWRKWYDAVSQVQLWSPSSSSGSRKSRWLPAKNRDGAVAVSELREGHLQMGSTSAPKTKHLLSPQGCHLVVVCVWIHHLLH